MHQAAFMGRLQSPTNLRNNVDRALQCQAMTGSFDQII